MISKILIFFKLKKGKASRGKSYYERENLIFKMEDFVLKSNPEAKQNYTTDKTIKYNGLALGEINEASVLRVFDEPDFEIVDEEVLKGHRVMFYRRTVDNFTFLMQFHFFRGHFIFVSSKVTLHGVLLKSDRKVFVNRILKKYIPDIELDAEKGYNIKVSDSSGNFLKINDEVIFSVSYVNNSTTNQQLLTNIDKYEEKLEQTIDEEVDDYI